MRIDWLASVAVAALVVGSPALAKDVVIHAGRLIDGVSKAPRTEVSILIKDDRITGVQPGYVTPPGAEVIDLKSGTVLPGLIDTHDHITAGFHKGDPIRNAVTITPYDVTIESVGYARATLLAGFTSVRDVGGETGVVVALKKAVSSGAIPGPRIRISPISSAIRLSCRARPPTPTPMSSPFAA